jgi:GH24 family phage-related lysozyme (muramidase)
MLPDDPERLRRILAQQPKIPADVTAVTAPAPVTSEDAPDNSLARARIRARQRTMQRAAEAPPVPFLQRAPMPMEDAIARAADFIAKHEGFREQAYKDLRGKDHPWTVGYGRTGPDVGPQTRMSEPEARRWLQQRVVQDARELQRVGAPVHPALLSFVYNAGHGRLKSSGALQAALDADWDRVAESMMKVVYGRDPEHNLVKLPGLERRRREEVQMLQEMLAPGRLDAPYAYRVPIDDY